MNGKVITFYSYKGGTGRSMALANIAWILAMNGHRVLVVDWDLEAPGLHRYFYPFLADPNLSETRGIIDIVHDVVIEGSNPEATKCKDWYIPFTDVTRYPTAVAFPFTGNGALHLIPAGRQDGLYSTRVMTFDWQAFYTRTGGGDYFERLRASMCEHYDFVLLDSRTGVTDTAGICTVQLPDVLVVCFTLNNQSIEGAAAVARSVAKQRENSPLSREAPLRILPTAMRVNINAELQQLQTAREYYREQFGSLFAGQSDEEKERYWGSAEIQASHFYSFEELPACFNEVPLQEKTLLRDYERLLEQIEGRPFRFPSLSSVARHAVIRKFTRKSRGVRAMEAFYGKLQLGQKGVFRSLCLRLLQIPQTGESLDVNLAAFPVKECHETQLLLASELVAATLLLREIPANGSQEVLKLPSSFKIHEWELAMNWAVEFKGLLRERQQLRATMETWQRTDEMASNVLRGDALKAAQKMHREQPEELSVEERRFITVSEAEAAQQSQREMEMDANEIVAWARLQLPTNPEFAAGLALTALERCPSPSVQDVLLEALRRLQKTVAFGEHANGLSLAAFSPDERWIALAGLDGFISLWRNENGQPVFHARLEHQDSVLGLSFGSDNQVLASASWDRTSVLWDLESGEPLKRISLGDALSDVALLEDQWIVAERNGKVTFFRKGDTDSPLTAFTARSPLNAIFVDPQERWLALCSGRSAHDNSGRTGLQLLRLKEGGGFEADVLTDERIFGLYWAGFSPDSQRIVLAGFHSKVTVWNISRRKLEFEFSIDLESAPVHSAQFSPDGQTILTATAQGALQRWSARDGRPVAALLNHPSAAGAIYNRAGTQILSGGLDGQARLWQLADEVSLPEPSALLSGLKEFAALHGIRPVAEETITTLRKQSSGPAKWIMVTGRSGFELPGPIVGIAMRLGQLLAEGGYGLVISGRSGVENVTAQGFSSAIHRLGRSADLFLRQYIPKDRPADFPFGAVLSSDRGADAHRLAAEKCDAAIILSGGDNDVSDTWLLAQAVLSLGKPLLPLPRTGGGAKKLFEGLKASNRVPYLPLLAEIDAGNAGQLFVLLSEILSSDAPVAMQAR